jgi:signal transduction histidine kinase
VATVAIDVRVPNALAVSGDPELLRLALANVVENAVHAMPGGGRLTIDARALSTTPPTIEIVFRDEGEGMDARVLEKALDPFFTTRAAGTGLGLAIVDNVVRSHGGEVAIESQPGSGTTVAIRVPLVRPAV